MTRSTSLLTNPSTTTITSTTTTTIEEKEGRELKKNDSIPAVPEFSMPQSSSAGSTDPDQTGPAAQNGRFKIVFKGVVDQLPQTASSPLPHPPSPSAPTNPPSNAIPSSSRSISPDSELPFALSSAPTIPSNTDRTMTMEEENEEPPLKKGKKGKKSKRVGGKKDKVKKEKKEKLSTTTAAITQGTGEVEEEPTVLTSSSAIASGSGSSLNRVCHHHKSLTKGEFRMTCRNNPECRTIWCQSCIEKYYIDCTPEKVFINDTTFECPVCLDRCKCAGCKKKRKEIAKELKSLSKKKIAGSSTTRGTPRASSVANSSSTTMTTRRSNTPAGNLTVVEGTGEGLEKVKMEEVEEEENSIVPPLVQVPPPPPSFNATRRPSFPTTVPSDPLAAPNAMIDPSLLPPPSSDSTFNSSTPSTFPPQPQPPVPTTSGILKIRVKPPKRPRTERGTFVPVPSPVPSPDPSYVPRHYVPEPNHPYPYVAVPPIKRGGRGGNRRGAGKRTAAATIHANEGASGPGSGTSFFGRPPSLGQQQQQQQMIGGGGGGVRPKRTKKVSSQYDDFAVEGVPAFGTPPPEDIVEGENVGGGRWGGNRRGGRMRRTTTNTLDSSFDQPSASTSTTVTRSASLQLPTAAAAGGGGSILIGPDGKRRRPRLSGLSSASSCSSISSSGDIMDEDEEFEGSYWAEQAERESDQRVRHWLLVPPTEPQPVLAGLERNLSEGGGEEVGFSPTATTGGDRGDVEMGERKRKEKVKWIEGPERRRRRAMALQKMKEEQEGKESSEEVVKRPLKRSMSWDAGESTGKQREHYNHCEPIKPFGNGTNLSSSASLPPPSPARKLSLPPPSPAAVNKPSSTCSEPTPVQVESPISYSDQPPPYESHFPPSATAPLPPQSHSRPPAIVVSPASTASQSPQIPAVPAPVSAPSTRPPSTNSTPLPAENDLEADLSARSADDMRLGLRLLDAIRTITGTKLAMEAMGIAPSALPTSTTVPPSPAPSPSLAPTPVVTSPVKSEPDDPSSLSLLISQEHAEYEAIRREERQRLLETALDPEKVFRTEAKGNDAHLLERAPEWGGMDVDVDEVEGRFKEVLVGGGDGMDESMFDFESFLTSGSKGEETSTWNTSISISTTSSSSVVSSSAPTPAPTHASSDDTMTPSSSNLAGSRPTSLPPPETPLKPIFSASHFLAPTVDDHQFWSLHEGGGGAATPTRGLIIESDFDFQMINGAANWIPQDEEVN